MSPWSGVPDAEWGERVVAVVQPTVGSAAPTLEELRAFAADALEPAALPARGRGARAAAGAALGQARQDRGA